MDPKRSVVRWSREAGPTVWSGIGGGDPLGGAGEASASPYQLDAVEEEDRQHDRVPGDDVVHRTASVTADAPSPFAGMHSQQANPNAYGKKH